MKNYYLIISLLFPVMWGFTQNPQIKNELPTVIPPSPTVAALMKFEEVPVSNYTGIPDISIPLFSSPTHSKDINLDISLKYHPSGVAPLERASDVGLGWSLFAGGVISRTVRGVPDELYLPGTDPKIGLYHNTVAHPNPYDSIKEKLESGPSTSDDLDDLDDLDAYYWDAQVRGILDTEHDLWQFNFMGQSGRFYIKKNQTGQLAVVPLDDYRVKIVNTYGVTNTYGNAYTPTGFTIYDEKGYKYTFGIIEVMESIPLTITTGSIPAEDETIPVYYNSGKHMTYNSSFYLSEIRDNNGKLLVELKYNENNTVSERVIDSSISLYVENTAFNPMSLRDYQLIGLCGGVHNFNPYPAENQSITQKNISAKKLLRINITGIAKIDFNYQKGREDENYQLRDSSYVFKGITIKDWAGNNIKKAELEHYYSTTILKRMLLHKVSFKNFSDTKQLVYNLSYKNALYTTSPSAVLNTDYWGYLNVQPHTYPGGFYRDTNPQYSTHETLQKMTLPTGGCTIFDFESNTYSHIGNSLQTNFDDNPSNWDVEEKHVAFNDFSVSTTNNSPAPVAPIPNNRPQFLFSITETQNVPIIINITYTPGSPTIESWVFNLYKIEGGKYILKKTIGGDYALTDLKGSYQQLTPGEYRIDFRPFGFSPRPNTYNFTANIYTYPKTRNGNNYKYLYGGGNRIKRIGYFKENNILQTFYEYNPSSVTPSKEKNFVYNFYGENLKSNGSLAYNVPSYSYKRFKKECTWCTAYGDTGVYDRRDEGGFEYNILTTFNNFQPIKTQGADVGYQNIRVYETGNGYSEYKYKSPIEVPENITDINLKPPFMPTENYDYKRGLITKETVFDEGNRKLKETLFDYDHDNYMETTGFRTYFYEPDFVQVYGFVYYTQYLNYIKGCVQYYAEKNIEIPPDFICDTHIVTNRSTCECFCYYGRPRLFVGSKFIKEAYGWTKLISKTTKEYFYPTVSSPANVVQVNETFTYNPVNKQLSESTSSNSKGEVLKTKYFYHTGNSSFSQNRISEIEKIESYRVNELLTTNKIDYLNSFSGNASLLPAFIKTSKGSGTLESRIRYNKYDEYGHPLEVQQESGMKVCYIWGYNKSQPIAKLENIAYSSIPVNLITAAQTASDTVTQSGLISALTALRNDNALSAAMITTYTYKPAVGISTITDPAGQTVYYEYDSFGRLNVVKDHDGNILSENEYHYKN